MVKTRETPTGVGRVARWFTRTFLGGQRSHDDELEAGVARELQQIKAIVEVRSHTAGELVDAVLATETRLQRGPECPVPRRG